MTLQIVERKTGNTGIATEVEEGKFMVTINGQEKPVAASTFKRWYKVTGEVEAQPTSTPAEAPAAPQESLQDTMARVEAGMAPEVQQLVRKGSTVPTRNEVNKAVADAVAKATPVAVEAPKRGRRSTKQEFLPLTDEQVAAIFNFEAKPAVEVTERICDITNGKEVENVNIDTIQIFGVDFVVRYQDVWTTSVIVMKDNKVIYDSPKASLKDTFNYFGFSEDMQRELKSAIKLARKSAQQDASVYWTMRAKKHFMDMGYEEEFFGEASLIITEYRNLNRGGRA